jgi:hypothetical protein
LVILTWRFRNIATKIPPSFLALIRRLQFLGRIFDQNFQMTDELSNIIRVVLAFDELNTLLDWRKAASKRNN